MQTKNKLKPQIGEVRARKRTSFWLESAIVVVDRAGRVVAKMSKVTEIIREMSDVLSICNLERP